MPKQFNDDTCRMCKATLNKTNGGWFNNGVPLCDVCYDNQHKVMETINPILNEPNHSIFNEPDHYHKYEIDTIGFLQKGFHPRVFTGFAIGSAVKYLHRYENKNGLEDLLKAQDFVNRLIDWHKKNPL